MKAYQPDYQRIVDAALNRPVSYPLYEHDVSRTVLEKLLDKDLESLYNGDETDKGEYFRLSSSCLASIGYDVFPFEVCITSIVQQGAGLQGYGKSLIRNRQDIESFPWDELPEIFFRTFTPFYRAIAQSLPSGMKAIGGVGNGVFEIVQDFVPMTDLAYLEMDDPEVFALLWKRVGQIMFTIWDTFLNIYGDVFAVCRFGDDLGFKSSLLIKPETAYDYILPEYTRIIRLIHSYNKPFLLHSCGAIWELMEPLINECRINAKHSNEDAIAPFISWVDAYGERIGNFGGIDMNILCMCSEKEIREYTTEVLRRLDGKSGIAIGSGNQIASYVPPEGFIAMVEAVRDYRGY